jgi:prepilin-type N-terminal cleavage/methylation domain-containing protein
MRRRRAGVTLLELMVVLAILAVMAGLTVVSLDRVSAPAPFTDADRVADARRNAITLGRPVRVLLRDSAATRSAQALPDGRVIGAAFGTHAGASGEVSHAPR